MTGGHGSGLRARVRAWGSARRHPADERGFSLIEILVAVVLLGALTVGMVGSLYSITYISSQQRSISVAEAEGRRLVEQIRALTYITCTAADEIDPDDRYPIVFDPGDGTTGRIEADVTSIQYWDGTGLSATSASSNPSFQPNCNNTTDCGLQRITLVVTASGSRATFTFDKRSENTKTEPACLT